MISGMGIPTRWLVRGIRDVMLKVCNFGILGCGTEGVLYCA